MSNLKDFLPRTAEVSADRLDLWTAVFNEFAPKNMLEIGVFGGAFSAHILKTVSSIEHYTMLDPWRPLDNWNKPCNVSQSRFEQIFSLAMQRTEFAVSKRKVLRGKTSDVICQIPDSSIDCAYIDGDHTLRGITIDLISVLPKLREGGCIALDDFHPIGRQHRKPYEPTLVFPFAVHFAEAHGLQIYALPHQQALIVKGDGFQFVDLTNRYSVTSLNELRSLPNEVRCRISRINRRLGVRKRFRSIRRAFREKGVFV